MCGDSEIPPKKENVMVYSLELNKPMCLWGGIKV